MKPDRVVVGVESEKAKDLMSRLYRPVMLNNFRVIFTDIPSAEMIKYAANSMLATRISFMNDIANLCELVGADVIWCVKVSVLILVLVVNFCIQDVGMVVVVFLKIEGFNKNGREEWL